MNCPKCGATIPSVNVNAVFNVAICPNYSCENMLDYREGNEPRFAIEKLKAPHDVELHEENGKLHLKIRTEKESVLGCLFLLLFIVLMIQMFIPIPSTENMPEFLAMGILRVVFLTPVILLGIYVIRTPNETFHELIVSPKLIQAKRYNWFAIERLNIRGLYVRHYLKKDATTPTYQLWGIGKRLKLRWALLEDLREDQAIYIAQVAKNFLDLNPYNDEKGKR